MAWFIPSITFFAFLYGGLGALIARTEEIGSIQGPLSLLPIASMYASIYATLTPHALWAKICAYIPPVSFFIEPSRLIIHASSGTEFALSFLIAVGISLLAAYLMLKLFEKSILGSGKKINLLRKAINRKERA